MEEPHAFGFLIFHGPGRLLRADVGFTDLGHLLIFATLEGTLGLLIELPGATVASVWVLPGSTARKLNKKGQ